MFILEKIQNAREPKYSNKNTKLKMIIEYDLQHQGDSYRLEPH